MMLAMTLIGSVCAAVLAATPPVVSPPKSRLGNIVIDSLGVDCGSPGSIAVVLNDDDQFEYRVPLNEGKGNATLSVKRPEIGRDVYASVRFAGDVKRTLCQRAIIRKFDSYLYKATFDFQTCLNGPFRRVTIRAKTSTPVPVSYLRVLSPCTAKASFSAERNRETTIKAIAYPYEVVLVQFGRNLPEGDGPGLFLFSDDKVKGLLMFEKESGLPVKGKALKKAKPIPEGVQVTVENLVDAPMYQRANTNSDFSGNAIAVDKKLLEGLESIELTVPK